MSSTVRSLSLFLLAFALLVLLEANTFGQRPAVRGLPAPTDGSPYQQRLSPYLDLLRTDNSVLGPYHTFLRPRRQIRRTLQVQNQQIERLQTANRLQTGTNRGAPSQRLPTGRGASFQTYLHFYDFESQSPGR